MSLSEFDIIERYFSDLKSTRSDVLLGIGDDCALLQAQPGKCLAVSTDTLVAGRHFFADTDAFKLGYKSLAVNLSDLAAMGAEPCWVSLALTIPDIDTSWLTDFANGFSTLCRKYGLQLIGGDTTAGPLSISVTVHGQLDANQALKRSKAQVGDLVCVSGHIGDAALALVQLQQGQAVSDNLQQALLLPEPRIDLGRELIGHANACIDISDGLYADLGHICRASDCQAVLSLPKLPLSREVEQAVSGSGSWGLPLGGGDDYELCFTLAADKKLLLESISARLSLPLTVIGYIQAGEGVICQDADGNGIQPDKTGFMHFYG